MNLLKEDHTLNSLNLNLRQQTIQRLMFLIRKEIRRHLIRRSNLIENNKKRSQVEENSKLSSRMTLGRRVDLDSRKKEEDIKGIRIEIIKDMEMTKGIRIKVITIKKVMKIVQIISKDLKGEDKNKRYLI